MSSQSKNRIIKLIATIFVFYGFIDSWGETLFSTTSFRGHHHSIYDLAPSHPVSSTASMDLPCGLSLFFLPGSSILNILCPVYLLSLFCTSKPYHPCLSYFAFSPFTSQAHLKIKDKHLKTLLSPPHSGLSFSMDDSEDSFALPLPLPSANSGTVSTTTLLANSTEGGCC